MDAANQVLSIAQFCITVGDSASIDGWAVSDPVANSIGGTVGVRALYCRRAERERGTNGVAFRTFTVPCVRVEVRLQSDIGSK